MEVLADPARGNCDQIARQYRHPEISKNLVSHGDVLNRWDQPLAYPTSSSRQIHILFSWLRYWREHGI
jgi:hypothetical protein